MAQYIDKSALVAEIKKCIYRCNKKKRSCPVNTQIEAICDNKIDTYNEVLSSLDALDIKEVDLEKEFYDFLDTLTGKDNGHLSEDELFRIAEYFFELGIKAQKGEYV